MKKIFFLLLPLLLGACSPVGNPSSQAPSSEAPSSEETPSSEESSSETSSVVVEGDGTLAKPYTVSQAVAIAETLAESKHNGQEVYVKGTVVEGIDTFDKATPNIYNGRLSLHFSDSVKTLLVYNANDAEGSASFVDSPVKVGDEVVVLGAIKNYKGTYEICYVSGVADCKLVSINGNSNYGEGSSEQDSSESSSTQTSTGDTPSSDLAYYKGINFALSGKALLSQLQDLMLSTHKKYTSYGEIRYEYVKSDRDPNKSGNIITFYDGKSVKGAWDGGNTYNREHVWAQANSNDLFGQSGCGADLHHLRPADPTVNSKRGNSKFGYVTGGSSVGGGELKDKVYEPADNYKGDTARIIMYCYMHYSTEIQNKTGNYMGKLILSKQISGAIKETLTEWNNIDPVDANEMARNEYCYTLQGNRNPFIDCPELMAACL